jgi:N utilization substance protein A
MQVMIPNALQPAEITDVQLYPRLGRAIVLVAEDQLSLAIGRRGQKVRLASKLVGWDIDIMTMDELSRDLDKAERYFSAVPGMQPEHIEALITEGFFSYTDLTFLEAEQLAEMIGVTPEEADDMIIYAEEEAERIEREGEPEFEPPAEPAPAAEGEAVVSDDAAAIAEGEVPAEEIPASGEAPAGGFESLFQSEGEPPTEDGVEPTAEEPAAEAGEPAPAEESNPEKDATPPGA